MEDVIKVVKSRKVSGLLTKVDTHATKNEAKKPERDWFLGILLSIIGAILLGNMLVSTRVKTTRRRQKASSRREQAVKKGERAKATGQEQKSIMTGASAISWRQRNYF